MGQTDAQIPRPLGPEKFYVCFQGADFGPHGGACGLRQHTYLIDEMAKLYGRDPGHTRNSDLRRRISLAQVVKKRIGQYLIS